MSARDFTLLLNEYPETTRNILSGTVMQLQELNRRWLETLRVEKKLLERKVREHTRELEEMSQRVKRELALAQTIQRNLLPDKHKVYPGIVVDTEYIPCDELGGDITGVFQIDETRLGVYGGDVCGHGIYAAMVMSYVKKLIETSVKRILLKRQYIVKPPGAVLTTINQSFITEISQGDPEIYLTLFLGVLDLEKLTFEFSSAGTHVSPLVISGGTAIAAVRAVGLPHRPRGQPRVRHGPPQFARGDALLFVSDGVIEARKGRGDVRHGPAHRGRRPHLQGDREAGRAERGHARQGLPGRAAAAGRHLPALRAVRSAGERRAMTPDKCHGVP